jgi:hypothetical protein
MKLIFDRLAGSDERNAMVDWLVLAGGAVLLAVSVAFALSDNTAQMSSDTAVVAPIAETIG